MKEKSEYKESAPWAYMHLFMSTILKKKNWDDYEWNAAQ